MKAVKIILTAIYYVITVITLLLAMNEEETHPVVLNLLAALAFCGMLAAGDSLKKRNLIY